MRIMKESMRILQEFYEIQTPGVDKSGSSICYKQNLTLYKNVSIEQSTHQQLCRAPSKLQDGWWQSSRQLWYHVLVFSAVTNEKYYYKRVFPKVASFTVPPLYVVQYWYESSSVEVPLIFMCTCNFTLTCYSNHIRTCESC